MKITALIGLAAMVFVTGCTSSGGRISKAKYYSPSQGVVSARHSGVRAASNKCNTRVYSRGVYIGGRKVRSREEAAVQWLGQAVRSVKAAERAGNKASAKGRLLRSKTHKRFVRAEKRYNTCLRSAGYTPILRRRR